MRSLILPLFTAFCGLTPACGGAARPVNATPSAVLASHDPLALLDALEALIAAGKDTPPDRELAYEKIKAREENTAAYAFARAAVTGRLAQVRGLSAASLVGEVERWALLSRKLDPGFRDQAATRLLGTLYVLAPSFLLEEGDSEEGLSLLEDLVHKRPDVPENHLRLAEAYLALGDPGPATPHLCYCQRARAALRRDDQSLLDRLLADAQHPSCAGDPARAKPDE